MKKKILPLACLVLVSCSHQKMMNREPSSLLSTAKRSCHSAIANLFQYRIKRNRIKNYTEAAQTLYKEFAEVKGSNFKELGEQVNTFEKFELYRVLLESDIENEQFLIDNFYRFTKIEQVYGLEIIIKSNPDLLNKIKLSHLLKIQSENGVHLLWTLAERKQDLLLEKLLLNSKTHRFNNYSTLAIEQAIERGKTQEEILERLNIFMKSNNQYMLKLHKVYFDFDFRFDNLESNPIVHNKETLEKRLNTLGLTPDEVLKYTEQMPAEFLRNFSPSTVKMEKSIKELFGKDLKLEAFNTGSAFSVYKVRNNQGQVVAVFKPSERPFTNFRLETDFFSMKNAFEKNGRQYRDKIFYELNLLFNMNMVPPSSVAESSHFRKGNVIAFLHNYTEGKKATAEQLKSVTKHEAQAMYLLDVITGHQDRHSRNWLIGENGDVKLIDNDLILHRTKKVRWRKFTNIDKYLPQAKGKIDSDLADKIINVTPEEFSSLLLKNGIPPKAIKYAVARLEGIQSGIIKGHSLEELVSTYQNLAVINYKSIKYVFYGSIPVASIGSLMYLNSNEEQ